MPTPTIYSDSVMPPGQFARMLESPGLPGGDAPLWPMRNGRGFGDVYAVPAAGNRGDRVNGYCLIVGTLSSVYRPAMI